MLSDGASRHGDKTGNIIFPKGHDATGISERIASKTNAAKTAMLKTLYLQATVSCLALTHGGEISIARIHGKQSYNSAETCCNDLSVHAISFEELCLERKMKDGGKHDIGIS